MNDERDPLLLDHEADGIRELDNKLPRWWVLLFYFTIAFSGVYLVYYHVLGAGDLMVAEYDKEMTVGNKIKGASMAKFESGFDTLEPSKDPFVISQGQQIFLQLCAPCHQRDGGGLVGPNLTDDYWIHGPKYTDNVKTIWNGVPEKGMITWKQFLKPEQVTAVASYIYTLRGTHPAKPKPPENQAGAQPAANVYE
jgi:cytochrome c oxidase cbb3-type subunit III